LHKIHLLLNNYTQILMFWWIGKCSGGMRRSITAPGQREAIGELRELPVI